MQLHQWLACGFNWTPTLTFCLEPFYLKKELWRTRFDISRKTFGGETSSWENCGKEWMGNYAFIFQYWTEDLGNFYKDKFTCLYSRLTDISVGWFFWLILASHRNIVSAPMLSNKQWYYLEFLNSWWKSISKTILTDMYNNIYAP